MNTITPHSDQLLITPRQLLLSQPLTATASATIQSARHQIRKIIQGDDHRLLVVLGPCSIHDPVAALDYAARLKSAALTFADELCIVMRVYFEKPRTTVGWKGFISDPHLDGSFAIHEGLMLARKLLLELNEMGMPAGTEFLDLMIPAYLSDLISWCAVGARTVESQTHRELASSFAMPVGFKNNRDGNIKSAIDAVKVARHSHVFLGASQAGSPAVIRTEGNAACHIILRGSNTATNYEASSILEAVNLLKEAELHPQVMVDCSHGNSRKDYRLQHQVLMNVMEQFREGSTSIHGVMLESNLIEGRQPLARKENLVYGQSVTDGCMGWDNTLNLLELLAKTVRTV